MPPASSVLGQQLAGQAATGQPVRCRQVPGRLERRPGHRGSDRTGANDDLGPGRPWELPRRRNKRPRRQRARDLPVADQLATVLAPAAHQPDGSYQVNIRLQPEDLGVVNVELRLESGTVNVSLHAEGDATGDMLRQNLGQLRQQLANAGLTTGRFDVSTGNGTGSNQGGPSAGQERAGRDYGRPELRRL